MRSPAFHRLLCRLALISALLLALAPTVGRVLSQPTDAWAQLCTMSGLKLVQLPASGLNLGLPHPSGGQAQDCEYCPLLGAVTALVVSAAPTVPGQLSGTDAVNPLRAPRLQAFQHPNGLGSRGPPALA